MSKENNLIPKLRFPEFEEQWSLEELDQCLDYLQPTPYLVESTNYNDQYETPVLTAGKSFILGYTDEKEGVFKENLPVIIFDDFTTASKFVDFPFKTKSSAMKILLVKNSNNIKFVYESIQTLDYEVGVHKRHWISVFSKLKIALPQSTQEQQKIADCLSSLDELIATHNDKLEALQNHKKGLMQNLFPKEGKKEPKYRFPEFEEDGEWVEKKLDDVAEINRGKSKHRPRNASILYGGKYPFIQTGDIREAGLYLTKYSQTYSDEGLKQSKLWNENTLCVTIAANIAETTILKIKACFPDSVIGIIPKNQIAEVVFIHYQFENFKEKVQGQSQGVAQANLNQKKLSGIEFAFPTLTEQQKIASFLSGVDELITAQAEKIEQLQFHKKGLMQGLFPKVGG